MEPCTYEPDFALARHLPAPGYLGHVLCHATPPFHAEW